MPVTSSIYKNQGDTYTRLEQRQRRPLRNSERIKLKFGSFGIGVLENTPEIRVSNLYSTHNGEAINRTLAVTAYPLVVEPAFAKEHEAIINGQSIGIVFEKNGWLIDKHHRYFGMIDMPPGHFKPTSRISRAVHTRAAIHVYSLLVTKNGDCFQYASIAEIHHPEFLQLDDLATIYGPEFDTHLEKKEQIRDFLEVVESRIRLL